MNYGMHLSATGALVNLHKMDVLANNLANVGTIGFKPDSVTTMQRNPARVEDHLGWMPSNALLERLGGGVFSGRNRVSFEQGPLETTGSPTDLAVEGSGFFVVRDDGDSTGDRYRLTRDGRFSLDRNGRLVSTTTGLPVMDASNQPIVLSDGAPVQIGTDGTIRQHDAVVARLQFVDVPDTSRLSKIGRSLFAAPVDALDGKHSGTGQIRQGMLEQSAVDPISALMAETDASRSAEANLTMIRSHDHLMDRAINVLGRVS